MRCFYALGNRFIFIPFFFLAWLCFYTWFLRATLCLGKLCNTFMRWSPTKPNYFIQRHIRYVINQVLLVFLSTQITQYPFVKYLTLFFPFHGSVHGYNFDIWLLCVVILCAYMIFFLSIAFFLYFGDPQYILFRFMIHVFLVHGWTFMLG